MIKTIIIVILIIIIIHLILRLRYHRKLSNFYLDRWAYFENHYYMVYKAWINKLSPEELKRVREHGVNKEKMEYELDEPA